MTTAFDGKIALVTRVAGSILAISPFVVLFDRVLPGLLAVPVL